MVYSNIDSFNYFFGIYHPLVSGSFLYIAAVKESQHGPTVSWENLKTKLSKSAHVIQQNWIELKWEEHCWANTTYNYNHVYLAAKKSNTNEQQGKGKRMMFFFIYEERLWFSQ